MRVSVVHEGSPAWRNFVYVSAEQAVGRTKFQGRFSSRTIGMTDRLCRSSSEVRQKVVGNRYSYEEREPSAEQSVEGLMKTRAQPSRQPRMLPAQSRACSGGVRCDASIKVKPPSEPLDSGPMTGTARDETAWTYRVNNKSPSKEGRTDWAVLQKDPTQFFQRWLL